MRLLSILLITCVVFSACEAGSLTDKFKQIGEDLKAKFGSIKTQLGEVKDALGSVAVDKVKSLGSQTLQALMGAFVNSFKGFNLGEILFGKRDLGNFQEESVGIKEFVFKLIEKTQKSLREILHKTFTKFADVMDSLVRMEPEEDVQSRMEQIHAKHKLAVRGVLGDALNVGIDAIKRLWYRVKGTIFGGTSDVAGPIMVGRRGLLNDAWNNFIDKVISLKEKIIPQYEKATEVTKNVAAVLGHYGGKMVQQAKEKAVSKMHETLGYLADSLNHHLGNAKSKFKSVKEELSSTFHNLMSAN